MNKNTLLTIIIAVLVIIALLQTVQIVAMTSQVTGAAPVVTQVAQPAGAMVGGC